MTPNGTIKLPTISQ